MTGDHRGDERRAGSNGLLVGGGVVVVLGLLGAGVALALAGWEVASIVGLLGGLGTVAGVLLAALGRLGTLTDRVDQVAQQTDGQLRRHISQIGEQTADKAANRVLTALGHPPPPPPGPAPRGRTRGR